jgi:NAD(P)-dependent dehydrogenase (short-subunit alcohol dehydrogenase family)
MRLSEKIAIITGAARGIGRAVALGFAREGASVVIADLRTELAERTVGEIASAGGQALAVEADVANLADQDRLVATTVERFGRIDILHNNAGVSGGAGDFFAYTPEDWDRILNVNLKAAFFLSQKVARVMIDQGRGGRILNTASIAAFIAASRPTIPYDISKAGLRQMTVSLAAYLAPHGIRVNAIAPGTIETEFSAGVVDPEQFAAARERRRQQTPLGRLGQPEDLVGAAIFLCSDEASYVTGHTLVVDGGLLAV